MTEPGKKLKAEKDNFLGRFLLSVGAELEEAFGTNADWDDPAITAAFEVRIHNDPEFRALAREFLRQVARETPTIQQRPELLEPFLDRRFGGSEPQTESTP